ncbi:hypothetical protein NBRC10512_003301 [Rhodotorula toruloides]|uniref:Ste24 endopeptidase n=1 Tax=Rhodotorula toruloides TaxID=5286 RepID=A0A061BQ63_RHOTO|nr:RHTO0S24e00782g1_1 [Rhodotorula toruloides]
MRAFVKSEAHSKEQQKHIAIQQVPPRGGVRRTRSSLDFALRLILVRHHTAPPALEMSSLLYTLRDKLADPAIPWRSVILAVVVSVELWESWVAGRQLPYLSPILHPRIPSVLAPYLPSDSQETYQKSQAYARDKLNFASVLSFVDVLETLVLLGGTAAPVLAYLGFNAGGSGWSLLKGLWDVSERLPFARRGEIWHSCAFLVLTTVISTVLSIPKEYYRNFVLEEKHGFNKMTRSIFVKDQVKGLAVSLVITTPLVAGIIKIIHWAGQDAILRIVAWAIVFIFVFQIFMLVVYPYAIMPLFNKFTPLPTDSPFCAPIKELADKLSFSLSKIWVIDGSIRSSHSNAFFMGVPGLPKHIVLYDTLLERSSPAEVEAILAHELGHWKGMHIVYLLFTSLVQVAFSLATFTLFLTNRPLLSAFGFHSYTPAYSTEALPEKFTHLLPPSSGPTILALMLASMLFSPLSSVLKFVSNFISRQLEYDADAFAAKLGDSYAKNLKKGLVSIHEKNLALYDVDPLYSAYNYTHPTLVERLGALDAKLGAKAGKAE